MWKWYDALIANHNNPISAAVCLDDMGIVWYFVTHSNPVSPTVCLDDMGMVWCFVTQQYAWMIWE